MTAKEILNKTILKYGYRTVYIGLPYEVLNTQFVHKNQVEELEILIEEYANKKALNIAEQAVEDLIQDVEWYDMDTLDKVISRIKQLTEQQ